MKLKRELNDLNQQDERYMRKALTLAKKAAAIDEVPIGALVISPYGKILGHGFNMVERYSSQRHHAEIRAIDQACTLQKSWRLDKCTLYVTLEPCMMCISLCALSRIERVVYGADSPLFGYHLDKEGVLALYTKQIKNITAHVLEEESARMLKKFFTQKRKQS